jgi:hypothetical protein
MKKYLIIANLCILGLLISASAIGAIQVLNESDFPLEGTNESIAAPHDQVYKTYDIKPKIISQNLIDSLLYNGNIQVTYNEEDDSHPSIGLDYNGNPCILFENKFDLFSSDIFFKRSPDAGESWPDDYFIVWGLEEPSINPEISFYDNGITAAGIHDITLQDPSIWLHHYLDIDDPSTWSIGGWEDDSATYHIEHTIATKGNDVTVVAAISDYHTSEYDLPQTVAINWNANPEDTSYPGVIWLIDDICTHINSDAGEKVYLTFERESSGRHKIYVSYCDVNIETEYTDWNLQQVAGSAFGNCTNPHISVSGDRAYIVYEDDKYGTKDIYCATSTSGNFWRRYKVVDSEEDELFPVVSANGDTATCLFTVNGNLYSCQSEDSGETWSEPIQINDAGGTIVEDFGNIDIEGPYGTWTDSRNGNNDIYFASVGSAPLLSAEFTAGVLGFDVAISNAGNAPAEEVAWSIDIDGLVILGSHSEGTIATINPGETKEISSGLILGLGPVTITVTIGDITLSAAGLLIGPLLLNFQEG